MADERRENRSPGGEWDECELNGDILFSVKPLSHTHAYTRTGRTRGEQPKIVDRADGVTRGEAVSAIEYGGADGDGCPRVTVGAERTRELPRRVGSVRGGRYHGPKTRLGRHRVFDDYWLRRTTTTAQLRRGRVAPADRYVLGAGHAVDAHYRERVCANGSSCCSDDDDDDGAKGRSIDGGRRAASETERIKSFRVGGGGDDDGRARYSRKMAFAGPWGPNDLLDGALAV